MTTIAWDGTTLAGDTLVVAGNLKTAGVKLYRLQDGRLYGGSGYQEQVLAVREWLETAGEKPKLEQFAAILITPDGACLRLEEQLIPMPIQERFHAVGSGRDFAMAAMALGKTALEAVLLAAHWDAWTNDDVMTLTLQQPERVDTSALQAAIREYVCIQEQQKTVPKKPPEYEPTY